MRATLGLLLALLSGHLAAASPAASPAAFPPPSRPVASIVTDVWSDEASRDDAGEAAQVMALAGVRPGLSVADIGAGSGYYTVRLAPRVGASGRVYAEDIVPEYLAGLTRRVRAARLDNVTIVAGTPGDPRLPPGSIDLALLVHMYHEIAQPYALLWNLRTALKPAARVAIVDSDRPFARHGSPPAALRCELAAVGYVQVAFHRLKDGNYLALFEPRGPRPEPGAIRPCRSGPPAGGQGRLPNSAVPTRTAVAPSITATG